MAKTLSQGADNFPSGAGIRRGLVVLKIFGANVGSNGGKLMVGHVDNAGTGGVASQR